MSARHYAPLDQRFWDKVNGGDVAECWLWTAGRNTSGYGQIVGDHKQYVAHRWAYEALIGPIPDGLQLDHLCRVRHYVNPWHLEPVTCRVNLSRGVGVTGRPLRTHCRRGGHEYAVSGYAMANGVRVCRPCRLASKQRYEERQRQKALAAGLKPRSHRAVAA